MINSTDLFDQLNRSAILGGAVIALLASLGLLAFGFGVHETWKEYLATKWPHASGVITGSEVRVSCDGRGGCSRLPDILYRYDVDSERLSSNRVTFGGVMLDWTTPEADRVVARYPVGTPVIVRYDPRNHQEAVLEPGRYMGTLLVGTLGAFSLGAAYVTYRRLLGSRRVMAGRAA
jgi:uncharacterized protein DUF3592